jgi:RND superfamily putative drug exporter
VTTLARLCHDNPWRVCAVWAVILAVGLGSLFLSEERNRTAGSSNSPRLDWATLLGGLDSARGETLIRDRFASAPVSTDLLCARLLPFQEKIPALTFDDTAPISGDTQQILSDVAQCRQPIDPAEIASSLPVPVTQLDLAGTPREVALQAAQSAHSTSSRWVPDSTLPDLPTAKKDQSKEDTAASSLQRAERIGLLAALVVLTLVLRSFVAPIVPILLGIASVGVSLGVTTALHGFTPPPFYVAETISMIGLAISIDYALFVIHRCSEERHHGGDPAASSAIAIRTILASGAVMIAAMAGMLLIPVSVFRELAFGAILVVAVGVAATATLLPPTLRLLGSSLNRPGRLHRPKDDANQRSIWALLARLTTRHPLIAVGLVAALLVPLNVEARHLRRDLAAFDSPPSSTSPTEPRVRDVETALSTAVLSVVEITVDGQRTASVQEGIDRLIAALGEDHRFAPLVTVQWNATDDLAVVSALLTDGTDTTASFAAIDRLRTTLIAEAFHDVPATVSVTGPVAARAEVLQTFDRWEKRVRLLVLASSFFLLLIIFRSIIVPLKAIATNLVTIGAVHGLLVLVFQKGVGANLLGFTTAPAIEAWVPLFLFCVLFGLSMDYHIFLLSRIREHLRRTGDHHGSLVAGLQTTGGVITGAATIMAVVFAAFAFGRVPELQQIGFGLAAAVILDATIVRCILTPALMHLLGPLNWYLPPFLRWLPDPGLAGGERLPVPASLPAD